MDLQGRIHTIGANLTQWPRQKQKRAAAWRLTSTSFFNSYP